MSTNPYFPAGPYAPPGAHPPAPRAPYDGTSVTGLLLVGTVVAAPVAIVLGLVGLRTTARGRRRGRWCAVLAVVGGLLVIAVLAGGLLLRAPLDRWDDPLGGVTTGDCVDVTIAERTQESSLAGRSCNAAHDAEVVFRGRLDGVQSSLFLEDTAAELCYQEISERYRTEMATGAYSMTVVLVGEPWAAADGDEFVCLAGDAGGGPLRAPIGVSA